MKDIIKKEIFNMNNDIFGLMESLKKNKVIIFPFNDESVALKQILENKLGVKVDYFCDTDIQALDCNKSEVISFDDFLEYKKHNSVSIFLSNVDLWFYDFWKFESAQVPCQNIVNHEQLNYYLSVINGQKDYIDDYLKELSETSSEKIKKSGAYITLNNLEKYSDVYAFLEDDLSKKVYLRMIAKQIMRCKYFFDVYSPNQYFDESLIKISDNEVFFDVGAYDGDTIEKFIKSCNNKYKSIYAFEPDSSKFPDLVANTCKHRDVAFLNVGLYNVTREVEFKNAILGSSHVSERHLEGDFNSTNYVNKLVIQGDTLNLKPTFIKMDIEGAELKALEGLKATIQSNQPQLAICAYHKLEDFWEIPQFIKSMDSNYKIYFRHHSFTDTETVCYAIK